MLFSLFSLFVDFRKHQQWIDALWCTLRSRIISRMLPKPWWPCREHRRFVQVRRVCSSRQNGDIGWCTKCTLKLVLSCTVGGSHAAETDPQHELRPFGFRKNCLVLEFVLLGGGGPSLSQRISIHISGVQKTTLRSCGLCCTKSLLVCNRHVQINVYTSL